MRNGTNSIPLVSICCVTYNHEKYLRQCLDGFVMQQTNFAFEILVHEDASTDSTAHILKEYENKYPTLFRCVYQVENQFKKQNVLINILFKMVRGKYIALCEGDDYWVDFGKLQKQVQFLEANDEFSICYHKTKILRDDQLSEHTKTIRDRSFVFNFFDSLQSKNGNTLSMVLRTSVFEKIEMDSLFFGLKIGDWPLECIATMKGSGFFMIEKMGVYRVHNSGLSRSFSARSYFESRYVTYERLKSYATKTQSQLIIQAQRRILFWFFIKSLAAFKVRDWLMSIRYFAREPFWLFQLLRGNSRWKGYFNIYYFPRLLVRSKSV